MLRYQLGIPPDECGKMRSPKGYNHALYENFIRRRNSYFKDFMDSVVIPVTEMFYLNTRKPGQLLLILCQTRKFALRMGRLSEAPQYVLKEDVLKKLFRGDKKFSELTEDDLRLNAKQKGVDMRIGIDITSLALKKQVDQIILIAGDSDFVPAAKLARREGIDFVLDPLWHPVADDLFEHIDGLQSYNKPGKTNKEAKQVFHKVL